MLRQRDAVLSHLSKGWYIYNGLCDGAALDLHSRRQNIMLMLFLNKSKTSITDLIVGARRQVVKSKVMTNKRTRSA